MQEQQSGSGFGTLAFVGLLVAGGIFFFARGNTPPDKPAPQPIPTPAVVQPPAPVAQPGTQQGGSQRAWQLADRGSVNISGGINNSTVVIQPARDVVREVPVVREVIREVPVVREVVREVAVPLPANGYDVRCEMLRAKHASQDKAWQNMLDKLAKQP